MAIFNWTAVRRWWGGPPKDPDVTGVLPRYRRLRLVQNRLNELLVKTIPQETLEECGRILGFFRKRTLIFDTEDEPPILMDYCIYYPQPDGRNLVARFLEMSPPRPHSEEMRALQGMSRAYYSLFEITEVVRGVGVRVRDIFRDQAGFIADIGFGNSARPHLMLATRVIPADGFLMTGGAALPVDASAARRIDRALERTPFKTETFDFRKIAPRQEAELAAVIIRECRSTGMTSHIAYADAGGPTRDVSGGSKARRIGRNEPCPCGSGKKHKMCCGRNQR